MNINHSQNGGSGSAKKFENQRHPFKSILVNSQQKIGAVSAKKQLDSASPINQSEMKGGKIFTNNVNNGQVTSHQQIEEVKSLKSALREATEENEILRERVIELEALYAAAQDEIERKNQTILEMANLLQDQEEEIEEDDSNQCNSDSQNQLQSKQESQIEENGEQNSQQSNYQNENQQNSQNEK